MTTVGYVRDMLKRWDGADGRQFLQRFFALTGDDLVDGVDRPLLPISCWRITDFGQSNSVALDSGDDAASTTATTACTARTSPPRLLIEIGGACHTWIVDDVFVFDDCTTFEQNADALVPFVHRALRQLLMKSPDASSNGALSASRSARGRHASVLMAADGSTPPPPTDGEAVFDAPVTPGANAMQNNSSSQYCSEASFLARAASSVSPSSDAASLGSVPSSPVLKRLRSLSSRFFPRSDDSFSSSPSSRDVVDGGGGAAAAPSGSHGVVPPPDDVEDVVARTRPTLSDFLAQVHLYLGNSASWDLPEFEWTTKLSNRWRGATNKSQFNDGFEELYVMLSCHVLAHGELELEVLPLLQQLAQRVLGACHQRVPDTVPQETMQAQSDAASYRAAEQPPTPSPHRTVLLLESPLQPRQLEDLRLNDVQVLAVIVHNPLHMDGTREGDNEQGPSQPVTPLLKNMTDRGAAGCPQLRSLILAYSDVADADVTTIADLCRMQLLPALEELHLTGNKCVTDASAAKVYHIIQACPQMYRVVLAATGIASLFAFNFAPKRRLGPTAPRIRPPSGNVGQFPTSYHHCSSSSRCECGDRKWFSLAGSRGVESHLLDAPSRRMLTLPSTASFASLVSGLSPPRSASDRAASQGVAAVPSPPERHSSAQAPEGGNVLGNGGEHQDDLGGVAFGRSYREDDERPPLDRDACLRYVTLDMRATKFDTGPIHRIFDLDDDDDDDSSAAVRFCLTVDADMDEHLIPYFFLTRPSAGGIAPRLIVCQPLTPSRRGSSSTSTDKDLRVASGQDHSDQVTHGNVEVVQPPSEVGRDAQSMVALHPDAAALFRQLTDDWTDFDGRGSNRHAFLLTLFEGLTSTVSCRDFLQPGTLKFLTTVCDESDRQYVESLGIAKYFSKQPNHSIVLGTEENAVVLRGHEQQVAIKICGCDPTFQELSFRNAAALVRSETVPFVAAFPVSRSGLEALLLRNEKRIVLDVFQHCKPKAHLVAFVTSLATCSLRRFLYEPDRNTSSLVRDCRFSVPCILEISRQMCQRVASLHGKGFIHNDIQPSMFLLFLNEVGHQQHGRKPPANVWKSLVTVKFGGTMYATSQFSAGPEVTIPGSTVTPRSRTLATHVADVADPVAPLVGVEGSADSSSASSGGVHRRWHPVNAVYRSSGKSCFGADVLSLGKCLLEAWWTVRIRVSPEEEWRPLCLRPPFTAIIIDCLRPSAEQRPNAADVCDRVTAAIDSLVKELFPPSRQDRSEDAKPPGPLPAAPQRPPSATGTAIDPPLDEMNLPPPSLRSAPYLHVARHPQPPTAMGKPFPRTSLDSQNDGDVTLQPVTVCDTVFTKSMSAATSCPHPSISHLTGTTGCDTVWAMRQSASESPFASLAATSSWISSIDGSTAEGDDAINTMVKSAYDACVRAAPPSPGTSGISALNSVASFLFHLFHIYDVNHLRTATVPMLRKTSTLHTASRHDLRCVPLGRTGQAVRTLLSSMQGEYAVQHLGEENCMARAVTWYLASYLMRERQEVILGPRCVERWLKSVELYFPPPSKTVVVAAAGLTSPPTEGSAQRRPQPPADAPPSSQTPPRAVILLNASHSRSPHDAAAVSRVRRPTAEALAEFDASMESFLQAINPGTGSCEAVDREVVSGGSVRKFCQGDLNSRGALGQRSILPLIIVVELCRHCCTEKLTSDQGRTFTSCDQFPYMRIDGEKKRCFRLDCAGGEIDVFPKQEQEGPDRPSPASIELHTVIVDRMGHVEDTSSAAAGTDEDLAVWDPYFPEACNVRFPAATLFFLPSSTPESSSVSTYAAQHCFRLWINRPRRLKALLDAQQVITGHNSVHPPTPVRLPTPASAR